LDVARVSQVAEGDIAQDFAAIMNALERGNRLFGGVDISEANAIELEDGRAENSKQQNGYDHFREGSGGFTLGGSQSHVH
jgi:hypothetical protein